MKGVRKGCYVAEYNTGWYDFIVTLRDSFGTTQVVHDFQIKTR